MFLCSFLDFVGRLRFKFDSWIYFSDYYCSFFFSILKIVLLSFPLAAKASAKWFIMEFSEMPDSIDISISKSYESSLEPLAVFLFLFFFEFTL